MCSNPITHLTRSLRLDISPQHTKHIQFSILSSVHDLLVLGLPWFRNHNPIVDWFAARVVSWSARCISTCRPDTILLSSTSIESPHVHCPAQILPCHSKLTEVFSAAKAARLPPHRPWDWAIDLLLGTLPLCPVFTHCPRWRPGQRRSMWPRHSGRDYLAVLPRLLLLCCEEGWGTAALYRLLRT